MSEHKGALRIPPHSAADPEAFEMLRVWASQGKQDVILMGLHYDDPRVWGVFLADLIRHIARSYHLNFNHDVAEASQTIREAFEAEMNRMTDWGEGTLLPKKPEN